MFSGIVESHARVKEALAEGGLLRIVVERPADFDDIKTGDSICTNGVCLTVETFSRDSLRFALGAETLAITGWSADTLRARPVNLERSLRIGDRVHGHMVSGHVDAVGTVVAARRESGCLIVDVKAPESLKPYLWKKGSCAIDGVSLTINECKDTVISVCLIPETLSRTNLGSLEPGSRVNLEIDMLARGLIHALRAGALESVKENS